MLTSYAIPNLVLNELTSINYTLALCECGLVLQGKPLLPWEQIEEEMRRPHLCTGGCGKDATNSKL